MNLIFNDRTAGNLGDAFGISSERQAEIANNLDSMVRDFSPPSGIRLVHMADLLEKIQSFTNNDNEFIYAFSNHIQWLYRTGRAVNPF
jgi:hypothetical protein